MIVWRNSTSIAIFIPLAYAACYSSRIDISKYKRTRFCEFKVIFSFLFWVPPMIVLMSEFTWRMKSLVYNTPNFIVNLSSSQLICRECNDYWSINNASCKFVENVLLILVCFSLVNHTVKHWIQLFFI